MIKIGIRPKDAWHYTPWETNMALTGYFEAENRQTERFAWVIGSMVGKSPAEVMGKPAEKLQGRQIDFEAEEAKWRNHPLGKEFFKDAS